MPDTCTLLVNGARVTVPAGTTVAGAILRSGESVLRRSVRAEPRGPLCGMGICFECRVTINDRPHCRSCQIVCADGMDVQTRD
jgi:aerobic-type carbon monoxide dehydrogenase small subunit (CoxS/CutS family)